jgi:rhomboid protease GluP
LGHGMVYSGRPGKQLAYGAIAILLSLVGLTKLSLVFHCFGGSSCPAPRDFFISSACLFIFSIGALGIVSAIRGLPRLTVTPEGIKFQSALTTKMASWNSLGPFVVKVTHVGGFDQKTKSASAGVTETDGDANRSRSKTITIPNSFQVPVEEVVADLNAARTSALGLDVSSRETTPEPMPEHAPAGLTKFTVPWLTLGLLAVLVVVFIAEDKFAVTPAIKHSPSLATLFAFGALSRSAIMSAGEWYRLFSGPLLHSSITHLVANGIALVFGGWFLEWRLGRLWFFALFTISAVGGSLMSLAVEPSNIVVSVGASGAITGMFASVLICSFRAPAGTAQQRRMLSISIRMLIPALIPTVSASGVHVDYGAHAGGALAGAALTLLLLRSWPESAPIPQWRSAAATLAVIGLALFVGSAGMVFANFRKYDVALIPQNELPKATAEYQERAAALVARYPGDPRSHLFLSDVLSDAHDNVGAERELRLALTTAQARSAFFGKNMELLSRGALASFLAEQGRLEEARTVAHQACLSSSDDSALRKLATELTTQHVCDPR